MCWCTDPDVTVWQRQNRRCYKLKGHLVIIKFCKQVFSPVFFFSVYSWTQIVWTTSRWTTTWPWAAWAESVGWVWAESGLWRWRPWCRGRPATARWARAAPRWCWTPAWDGWDSLRTTRTPTPWETAQWRPPRTHTQVTHTHTHTHTTHTVVDVTLTPGGDSATQHFIKSHNKKTFFFFLCESSFSEILYWRVWEEASLWTDFRNQNFVTVSISVFVVFMFSAGEKYLKMCCLGRVFQQNLVFCLPGELQPMASSASVASLVITVETGLSDEEGSMEQSQLADKSWEEPDRTEPEPPGAKTDSDQVQIIPDWHRTWFWSSLGSLLFRTCVLVLIWTWFGFVFSLLLDRLDPGRDLG